MSDTASISLDFRQLDAALLFVEKHTGRAIPESLNRAGKNAIIGSGTGKGAMQLTPKASAAKIRALPYKTIAGAVAKKLRAKGKLGKGKGAVSTPQFKNYVRYEQARRAKSTGFAAFAGWNNAAKAMGGRGIGKKGITDAFSRSQAAKGYGTKATPSSHKAVIANTVAYAGDIGGLEALQEGINNAAKDLVVYGERKIAEAAKRAGF